MKEEEREKKESLIFFFFSFATLTSFATVTSWILFELRNAEPGIPLSFPLSFFSLLPESKLYLCDCSSL